MSYVTYDPSDPLSVVAQGTVVNQDGSASATATGYYKVQVPSDSSFIFKPNAGSDLAGSTAALTLPTGFSAPCYNVVSKTWQELSAVEDYTDYAVGDSFPDNILGVNATYYDYLSDEEYNGAWLNPQQSGTGFNGSSDDWYPFFIYNQKISALAKSNSSWSTPLYFGNFCNTDGAYSTSDHGSGSWTNATNSDNAYKFNYLANNSNGLKSQNHSYQGLVYDTLINNRLHVTSGLEAPYFNNEWLQNEGIAKVIKGTFPFTVKDNGTYKYYEFNSKNAEDNVYFTWATDGSHTYPTTVNYGAGSSYGIDDGIKYFMNGGTSGKGIFPFNNVSGTKGDKANSNENKNYGFGIRMDIDFRVPTGGVIPGTSTPVTFEFTGDDDLWVYVTDNDTGASQLVLDMGGAHKESHGVIDFSTKTATVDFVQNNSNTEYGYVYLSKDNTGWGDTYAYFFNANGTVGEAWPGTKMSTYDSSTNLRAKIPEGAETVIFTNNSGAQTENVDLTSTKGAYWLSNTLGVNEWETVPSDAGMVSKPATKYFNFDNTDDQKTYTLSVFYNEFDVRFKTEYGYRRV